MSDCSGPRLAIDVITIFPELVREVLRYGVVARGIRAGALRVEAHDLRAWSRDPHRKVDDYAYGGGPGMVLRPEPLIEAVAALRTAGARVILLGPRGRVLNQDHLRELARESHLVVICGRYEGVDERVREAVVDQEISIGDFILSGGEVPAMVLIDGLARLVPGVVGNPASLDQDAFAAESWLLGCPQYTRPREYGGLTVPEVLLSGHHARIAAWRRAQARRLTVALRPDLLSDVPRAGEDRRDGDALPGDPPPSGP